MKQFALDYLLNVAIAVILLFSAGNIFDFAKNFYYSNAPISWFYENGGLVVSDVCLGSLEQDVQSVRFVKGTIIGYRAVVIRELGEIENDTFVKIHEERVEPFIEFIPNGVSYRTQRLPFELDEGQYQWLLYPSIIIQGVTRADIPPIESNIFNVVDCEQ